MRRVREDYDRADRKAKWIWSVGMECREDRKRWGCDWTQKMFGIKGSRMVTIYEEVFE